MRLVALLLARPEGQTRHELADHFGWHQRDVVPLLMLLAAQGLVMRQGDLYRAAPDASTRGEQTADRRPRPKRRALDGDRIRMHVGKREVCAVSTCDQVDRARH
ncbi:MAG: hypothetical protein K8M05_38600 [Deltaproteobacteria bacterium]|nr:hypothetical protein [Kofleriaceae bacterium]